MRKPKGGKSTIKSVPAGKVTWLDVTEPSAKTLAALKKRYPFFSDADLEDCLPPFQRPKLLERPLYLFLVFLLPVYDRTAKRVRQYEVDFFIGKDFVVTVHAGGHESMKALSADCSGEENACLLRSADDPLRLTHDILHELIVSCFPILTTVSHALTRVEERLFEDVDGELVREILRLRTDIVTFRKAMQGHESSIARIMERGKKFFPTEKLRPHFEDLNGHYREIKDFLENYRDTVNALYDSHLSLVTYRTNQATKTLTALAFIVFPMTLVAAVFSMRAEHMPFVGRADDFWIMLAIVFGTMLAIVVFMKRKKWLD
jgi:magnesium transporter